MVRPHYEPLERCNVLRTRNPDELREKLSPLYAVTHFELPPSKVRFDATLNHHRLEDTGVSFARYGAPIKIAMSNTDFFTQGFGIRGYGKATTDGKVYEVAAGKGGAAGPGATALLDYRAGFEHVFLKFTPDSIYRKLCALLGNPHNLPLRLDGRYDEAALAGQYRLLRFVISELDAGADGMSSVWLAEFNQALIVAFLYSNQSNYSSLLSRRFPPIAAWQVRHAMEYIEANWDKPLSIETLAAVTGASTRSLFETFRKSRGCSPMAFIRHVRLNRARDLLSRAAPGTSVSSVVAVCGFSNPGHFSKLYFESFGELPSETLNRAKRRK